MKSPVTSERLAGRHARAGPRCTSGELGLTSLREGSEGKGGEGEGSARQRRRGMGLAGTSSTFGGRGGGEERTPNPTQDKVGWPTRIGKASALDAAPIKLGGREAVDMSSGKSAPLAGATSLRRVLPVGHTTGAATPGRRRVSQRDGRRGRHNKY